MKVSFIPLKLKVYEVVSQKEKSANNKTSIIEYKE